MGQLYKHVSPIWMHWFM